MERFAQIAGMALLLAATALHAGCGNSASGLTTGDVGKGDGPAGISNEDPLARPMHVAWTSARARRCGFYFEPEKLRATYLAYEAKQGAAGDQLAKFERSYDTTFRTTSERAAADPNFCSDRKSAEIKPELQRHMAGDYAPNFPKPKPVAACGFFGCGSAPSDEPLDSKKFWQAQDANRTRR